MAGHAQQQVLMAVPHLIIGNCGTKAVIWVCCSEDLGWIHFGVSRTHTYSAWQGMHNDGAVINEKITLENMLACERCQGDDTLAVV